MQVADTYQKWQIGIAHTLSMHKGYTNISNDLAEGANNLISNILQSFLAIIIFPALEKELYFFLEMINSMLKGYVFTYPFCLSLTP